MRALARGAISAGDVLLLVAASIAASCSYSTTSAPYNMAAIMVGAIALVIALVKMAVHAPQNWTIALALAITLVPQTLRPPSPNVHQTAFYPWSVAGGVAAVILLALSLLGPLRLRSAAVLAALAAMTIAAIITVPGGQRPEIDVWDIFQQSSAGLFHGINPYEITNFVVPKGQTAGCFNYLPASFLASWLGWVSFSDARYAEVTIMVIGWVALSWALWAAARQRGVSPVTPTRLIGVAMTLAGTLRVAQQAWNESLILGFLLIGAALVLTRWAAWAWIPVALALATKQHVALLLPLLACWPCFGVRRTAYAICGAVGVSLPWLVWNPNRFSTCTVKFFLDLPERHDSISLWRYLPQWLQSATVLVAIGFSFYVALRHVPRTVGGLLIASAVVLFGFDLFNKQSFENQWWLFAQLIVGGLAVRSVEIGSEGTEQRLGTRAPDRSERSS